MKLFGELVATAQYVDRLQATTVTAFGALARFGGEVTGVQLQALDLLGGDQGTGVAFRQQARVVVVQHRQGRHLVTVGQHSVGETELDCSTGLGQVVCSATAVTLLEEVDAAGTAATLAAVQAQCVQAEGVNAHAHGALGKTGRKGADGSLAPLGLVLVTVFVVTVDVGVAQQHFQAAVFNKTLGVGLAVGHGLCSAQNPQCNQADPLFKHFIFLITVW